MLLVELRVRIDGLRQPSHITLTAKKSTSNIYSSDVAQFKTSFTLVQCLSNWLKSRDCCGLDALQSVKRCWEGLLWRWANTICFPCLCCFAGLVFCFYCSASIHLKEGKPPATDRDASSKAQHSSPLMMRVGIQGHELSHSDIAAFCTVVSLPNAPLLKHIEELAGSWLPGSQFMTPTSYSLVYLGKKNIYQHHLIYICLFISAHS